MRRSSTASAGWRRSHEEEGRENASSSARWSHGEKDGEGNVLAEPGSVEFEGVEIDARGAWE